MKSENPDVLISNFITLFEGHDIYLGNCNKVLKKYKTELRKLVKRTMYYRYLDGKSTVPLRTLIKISEKEPRIWTSVLKYVHSPQEQTSLINFQERLIRV